jgi:glycosyltransferase involved in cell wall biosynthesis
MQKPIILICIDWFTPGYLAGGPIKSALNFCKSLMDDYEIYVLTSNKDAGNETPYPGILTNKWIDFEKGIKVQYLSQENQNYSNIKQIIKEIQPNYIYLNSIFSIHYTFFPVIIQKWNPTKCKIVLAPRGMLHKGALQYKPLKKRLFLRFAQLTGMFKEVVFQATDAQEKADIQAHFINNPIVVLPNLNVAQQASFISTEKKAGYLDLIFISRIVPKKNLIGILDVLGHINLSIHLTFNIYGSIEDKTYYSDCEAIIARLPLNFKVNYCGPIRPENIDQALKAHHLFVLPTFGENFGHAIFEALLAGRPVLISDQTPWQDLEEKNAGWAIPLVNKEKWVEIIASISNMDATQFEEYTKGAWNYAAGYLKNNNLLKEYQNLFS